MGLEAYWKKRDFKRTPEPKGKVSRRKGHRFVCQEHHASSLHFDFRLEAGGVLKSWSVRKGPSMDPAVRRLAVPTEDHPVEYLEFQGTIPEGNYGAGEHMIWDGGSYELLDADHIEEQLEKGKVKLRLKGGKLKGIFNFFRLGQRDQWLLVKGKDEHAEAGWRLKLLMPDDNGNNFIAEDEKPGKARSSERPPKSGGGVKKTRARAKEGESVDPAEKIFKSRKLEGDRRVEIGGYVVSLTSLDRVYWPDDGITKADLVRYYLDIAEQLLLYLEDRPLILKRYPAGIDGKSFHQHDVDEVPEFVRTAALEMEDKGTHTVDYVVGGDLPTQIYLTNLGTIERHPWHSRVDKLERPDWFVFDMDPGEGVEFETICEAALIAKDVIGSLGLESYAKTSGSRGIHVYVPIERDYTYEQVADVAAWIAKRIADKDPAIATVERSKSKRRGGQIYVDHMQNAYGKSVVAPYSVRPKAGATVSAPLDWKEVNRKKISIEDFTIKNIPKRLKKLGDIFRPVLDNKQSLDEALAKIGKKSRKK